MEKHENLVEAALWWGQCMNRFHATQYSTDDRTEASLALLQAIKELHKQCKEYLGES